MFRPGDNEIQKVKRKDGKNTIPLEICLEMELTYRGWEESKLVHVR
jgi:hypothetical protein